MKRLSFIVSLLLILFSYSCTKPATDRVVSGAAIYTDNKENAKNIELTLYVRTYKDGSVNSSKKMLYKITTDGEGKFSILVQASEKDALTLHDVKETTTYWSKDLGKKDLEINAGIIEIDR